MYKVECSYKDTCLSDYLQDHHNREGELLLGILPYCQDEEEAVDDLMHEIYSADHDLPEGVTNELLTEAFTEAVKGVDFRYIDADGNCHEKVPEDDSEDTDQSAYVWFVLTWEEVHEQNG